MEKEFDKYRILVVDDEEDICEILQFNLAAAGFDVETAANAEEALLKLRDGYHLVLLDIMMDGMSGLQMAQLLREEYQNNIPVIFMSALDSEADILNGFDKGGDDYIPKPFSIKEVIARVKAVLQRSYGAQKQKVISDSFCPDRFVVGKLVVDYTGKRVFIGQMEIMLTKKENEILVLLTQNPNKIYSREDILRLVWRNESYVLDRTVDVHIARLRKKLADYGDMIVNRSGYGYCFHPEY